MYSIKASPFKTSGIIIIVDGAAQVCAHSLSPIRVIIVVATEQIGKEEDLQHHEKQKQLDENQKPQPATQWREIPKTLEIETPHLHMPRGFTSPCLYG